MPFSPHFYSPFMNASVREADWSSKSTIEALGKSVKYIQIYQ